MSYTFLLKKNNAQSTLNGGINTAVTSVTVTSASSFPVTGNFMCTLWNSTTYPDPSNDPNMEIVEVTGVSTNTFTIVRAQESTTASNHSNGDTIQLLFTAGQIVEHETVINNILGGNTNKRTVGCGYGTPGSGNVVPTGIVGYGIVPFAGTITGYAIIADQSGSVTIDVWKANNAVPTVSNTITASALPTLTSSQYINSTTLTGWTTSVAVNDVFGYKVTSSTTINSFTLVLFITTS